MATKKYFVAGKGYIDLDSTEENDFIRQYPNAERVLSDEEKQATRNVMLSETRKITRNPTLTPKDDTELATRYQRALDLTKMPGYVDPANEAQAGYERGQLLGGSQEKYKTGYIKDTVKGFLTSLASIPTQSVAIPVLNLIGDEYSAQTLQGFIDQKQQQYAGDTDALGALKKGDIDGFLGMGFKTFIQSVPITAAWIANPYLGAGISVGAGATPKYSQLDREYPELAQGTKLLSAANAGAWEAGSEYVSMLLGFGKTIKMGSKLPTEILRKKLSKAIASRALPSMVKQWGIEAGVEGIEEVANFTGDYLGDVVLGIKDFNSAEFRDGNINAGILGAAAGGWQGGIGMTRNMLINSRYMNIESKLQKAANADIASIKDSHERNIAAQVKDLAQKTIQAVALAREGDTAGAQAIASENVAAINIMKKLSASSKVHDTIGLYNSIIMDTVNEVTGATESLKNPTPQPIVETQQTAEPQPAFDIKSILAPAREAVKSGDIKQIDAAIESINSAIKTADTPQMQEQLYTALSPLNKAKETAVNQPKPAKPKPAPVIAETATTETPLAEPVPPVVETPAPAVTEIRPKKPKVATKMEDIPLETKQSKSLAVGKIDENVERTDPKENKAIEADKVGKTATVSKKGKDLEIRYALIDRDKIVVSHSTGFQENAEYPQEIQNRQRDKSSLRGDTATLSAKLNPDLLMDNPIASDGRPIVVIDKNGNPIALTGNGRLIAMNIKAESKEGLADYEGKLKERLADFGISDQDTKGKVLVGVYYGGENLVELARLLNVGEQKTLTKTEQATSDATLLANAKKDGNDLLLKLDMGTQALMSAANTPFIEEFISMAIPDVAGYKTDSGSYTNELEDRIENALFMYVFNNDSRANKLLEAYRETGESNVKFMLNGIMDNLKQIARLRNLIEKHSLLDLDITKDLIDSLSEVSRLRAEGVKLEEVAFEQDLFSNNQEYISDDKLALYQAVAGINSNNKARLFIAGYYASAYDAINPDQSTIFSSAVDSKEQFLDTYSKEWMVNYGQKTKGKPVENLVPKKLEEDRSKAKEQPAAPAAEAKITPAVRANIGDIGGIDDVPFKSTSSYGNWGVRYTVYTGKTPSGFASETKYFMKKKDADAFISETKASFTKTQAQPAITQATFAEQYRKAQEGKLTAEQIDAQLAFYDAMMSVYARELGITLDEAYARKIAGVTNEKPKGSALNQSPDSPASQYSAVRKQYEGTEQWMKAPNGKPTKLNERQWIQVRTPNFLNWFGDWLNDPKNASKVVDENGEPMVVYHGTGTYKEFSKTHIFNPEMLGSATNAESAKKGFFFAESKGTAVEYAGLDQIEAPYRSWLDMPSSINEIIGDIRKVILETEAEYVPSTVWEAYGQFVEDIFNSKSNEERLELYLSFKNNESLYYDVTEQEIPQDIEDDAQESLLQDKGFYVERVEGDEDYQEYLDAIDEIQDNVYELAQSIFYDEKVGLLSRLFSGADRKKLEPHIRKFDFSRQFDPEDFNIMPVFLSIKTPLDYYFKEGYRDEKFNDLMQKAIADNKDGAIFRNVKDGGGYDNIYVALTNTQIKSATGNTGEFSPTNPDIRYQDMLAYVTFDKSGKATIGFLSPDITSGLHEQAHIGRAILTELAQNSPIWKARLADAETWCGVKDGNWTTEAEEKFAKGYEKYLYEGQAPTASLKTVFAKIKQWISELSDKVRALAGIELDPNIRAVYDAMLGKPMVSKAPASIKGSEIPADLNSDEGQKWIAFNQLRVGLQDIKDGKIPPIAEWENGNIKAVVSKSTKSQGKWQLTFFTNNGDPAGDTEFDTEKEAIERLAEYLPMRADIFPASIMFTNKKMEHYYDMRLRPPDFGTHPMNGLIRVDYPEGVKHGRLVYNRMLSDEEIKSYELRPIGYKTENGISIDHKFTLNTPTKAEQVKSRVIADTSSDPVKLESALDKMADRLGNVTVRARKTGSKVTFFINSADTSDTLVEVTHTPEGYTINGGAYANNAEALEQIQQLLNANSKTLYQTKTPDEKMAAALKAKERKDTATAAVYRVLQARLRSPLTVNNWRNAMMHTIDRVIRIQNPNAIPFNAATADAILNDESLSEVEMAKKIAKMEANDKKYREALRNLTGFDDLGSIATISLFTVIEEAAPDAYALFAKDQTIEIFRTMLPELRKMQEFKDIAYTDMFLQSTMDTIISGQALSSQISRIAKLTMQTHRVLVRMFGKAGVNLVRLAYFGNIKHSAINYSAQPFLRELNITLNTSKNVRKAKYNTQEQRIIREAFYKVEENKEIADKLPAIIAAIKAENPNINTQDITDAYNNAKGLLSFVAGLIREFNATHAKKIGLQEDYFPREYDMRDVMEIGRPEKRYLYAPSATKKRELDKTQQEKMPDSLHHIMRNYLYKMSKYLSYYDLAQYHDPDPVKIGEDKYGKPIFKDVMSQFTRDLEIGRGKPNSQNNEYVQNFIHNVIGYYKPSGNIDRVFSTIKNSIYTSVLAANINLTIQNFMQRWLIYSAVDAKVADATVKHVKYWGGKVRNTNNTPIFKSIMEGYVIHNSNLIAETQSEAKYVAETSTSKLQHSLSQAYYSYSKVLSNSPFQKAELGNRGWGHASGVLQVVMNSNEYKQAVKSGKTWAQSVETALSNQQIYDAAKLMGGAVNAEINADADMAFSPALYRTELGQFFTFVRYAQSFILLLSRNIVPVSMKSQWSGNLHNLLMSGQKGAIGRAEAIKMAAMIKEMTSKGRMDKMEAGGKISSTRTKGDKFLSRAEAVKMHKYMTELLDRYIENTGKDFPSIVRGAKGNSRKAAAVVSFVMVDALVNLLFSMGMNVWYDAIGADDDKDKEPKSYIQNLLRSFQILRFGGGVTLGAGMLPQINPQYGAKYNVKATLRWLTNALPFVGMVNSLSKQLANTSPTDQLAELMLDE